MNERTAIRPTRAGLWLGGVLTASLALSGCATTAFAMPQLAAPTASISTPIANAATPVASSQSQSYGDGLAAFQTEMENIYSSVNPSVVNIRVVDKTESDAGVAEMYQRYFGFQVPDANTPQYQSGSGSGFVWDADGHIITNNHVIDGADRITVTFHDGTILEGKVVGSDPDSDLAVIKVDAPAGLLKPVTMGDSKALKVGQVSIAIGNPYGLQSTMTSGIVSALGRLLPVESSSASTGSSYSIPDVIQTDAPINPGNSGGVLLDIQGQVIGVTSAIISESGSSAGIGFAIPSAIVKKVVPELISDGSYQHTYLGVSGTSLTPEIAEKMGLDANQRGGLVIDVTPGGPADKAGLRGSDRQITIDGQDVRIGGDVITAIDGQTISDFDDVISYLSGSTSVGQKIELTVLRGGKEQSLDLTLAARPQQESDNQSAGRQGQTEQTSWLGIVGTTLTPALAQAMDLPARQEGVLIERVERNSPADEANLQGSYKPITVDGQRYLVGGDVIVAANEAPLASMEELSDLLSQSKPGEVVHFGILREGKQETVQVTLGAIPTSTP